MDNYLFLANYFCAIISMYYLKLSLYFGEQHTCVLHCIDITILKKDHSKNHIDHVDSHIP
jgi:hypothetical protein